MKVLLVDDSVVLQSRLVSLIEECEGVSAVLQAFHVEVAKKMLRKNKINVIVSDIRMPGGGGFELLRYVKEEFKDIVFIFITLYDNIAYRQRAQLLGANYFFSKSDEFQSLLELIEKLSQTHYQN